ncbi:hypothetical protein D9M71_801760 [compost metagenome]
MINADRDHRVTLADQLAPTSQALWFEAFDVDLDEARRSDPGGHIINRGDRDLLATAPHTACCTTTILDENFAVAVANCQGVGIQVSTLPCIQLGQIVT